MEVATQVGLGSSTVYRVLVRHGVPIRQGFDTHVVGTVVPLTSFSPLAEKG